jgi:hypothetical protein
MMLTTLGVTLAVAIAFSTDLLAPDENAPSESASPPLSQPPAPPAGPPPPTVSPMKPPESTVLPAHSTEKAALLSDAEATKRLHLFYREALRMEPVWGTTQVVDGAPPWALMRMDEAVAFRVWSPDGKPLERAQALRRAGALELAEQQETSYALAGFEFPLLVGALALSTILGAGTVGLVSVALGVTLVPMTTLAVVAIVTGAAIATVMPIVAFAILRFVPQLFAVSDDDARLAIQEHNKAVADKAGLPSDGIPFPYLGY